MAEKKHKGIGKVIAVLFLIFIFVAIALFMYRGSKSFFGLNQTTNQTVIIQNQTNIEQTIIEPGKSNVWDAVRSLIIWGIIGAIVISGFYFGYRLLSKRQAISEKNKEKCIRKAKKVLIADGYPISMESEPKYSYRIFGIDEEKFPGWGFGFVKEGVDFTKPYISGHALITCIVDAKTLDVFNENQGRNWDDFIKELKEQRFGRHGVPNWPGKTEKEPSIFDWSKAQPSVTLTPEESE